MRATPSCRVVKLFIVSPSPWVLYLLFLFHSLAGEGCSRNAGCWLAITRHQPLPVDYQGQKNNSSGVAEWNIVLIKLEILFLQPPDYF